MICVQCCNFFEGDEIYITHLTTCKDIIIEDSDNIMMKFKKTIIDKYLFQVNEKYQLLEKNKKMQLELMECQQNLQTTQRKYNEVKTELDKVKTYFIDYERFELRKELADMKEEIKDYQAKAINCLERLREIKVETLPTDTPDNGIIPGKSDTRYIKNAKSLDGKKIYINCAVTSSKNSYELNLYFVTPDELLEEAIEDKYDDSNVINHIVFEKAMTKKIVKYLHSKNILFKDDDLID